MNGLSTEGILKSTMSAYGNRAKVFVVFVLPLVLTLFVSAPSAQAAFGWGSPGGWEGATYIHYDPGAYYVRAWTKDANGNWSLLPSAPLLVQFVPPPIVATCKVDKTTGYAGTTIFTWSVSAPTGGAGANTYTYNWGGTDGITGSGTYIPKTYTTVGTKTASVTVSSGISSQVFDCGSVTVTPPPPTPDLTVTNTTVPATGYTGQSIAFSGTVSNIGTAPATNFPNTFEIDDSLLTQVATMSAGTVASLGVNATTTASAPYSFTTPGTYNIRLCANMDTKGNLILAELNANNNCGGWQVITVSYPPITASCAVSPASGTIATPYLWSATVSGGSGTYTYSWSGDDLSLGAATTASFTKTYATSGTKSASVTVTSAGAVKTVACTNAASISPPPTITVAPTAYTTTLPANTVTATYTLTNATSADTNCRLLDNTGSPLTAYASCSGSRLVTTPTTPGIYAYYVQANKTSTNETVTSNIFTVSVKSLLLATGALTVPATCVIASGASICMPQASWTTANATGAYLFDRTHQAALYTGNSSAGSVVYVSRPQTIFDLKNGDGTLLDSKVVTTSCATGTTWSGSVCAPPTPALVNGVCSATHYVCVSGTSASPINGATTYTWTCTGANGGTDASCTEDKPVVPSTPLSGSCAPLHYTCAIGTSGSNVNGTSSYTWTCAGPNGGATVPCTESKAMPVSGSLIIPQSCVIAIGASTCVVEAAWDLANATDAYLLDANPHGSGILYGRGIGTIPTIPGWNGIIPNGHVDPPVYVAYPQTVFNLNNGNTTLATSTVTASCAAGSTWNGTLCLQDVAITSFTPTSASIANGASTLLNWSGVTGGGTITCSIDQGVGAAAPASGGSISSLARTTTTTFTLTCGNGVGPNATKSTTVTVAGSPTGTLTVPPSCTIAVGASTCTVSASWTTANATGAYLFDANASQQKTLYTANSSTGSTVWVANPQTVLDLKNGDGTILAGPTTVTASCAAGSAWDGATCAANTYSCTNLPAHGNPYPAPDNTGLTVNTAYTYSTSNTAAKCEFTCANGYNWNGSACSANSLSVSCTGTPGNPYVSQSVTWASSVGGGSGAYTYSWSGDDLSPGAATTVSFTKTYTTAGVKHATVTATDSTTGALGSANCATGAAQPNGPMTSDTGGVGVSVGACASTLTANPSSLEQGNTTYLTWSVTGGSLCASSCSGGLGFDTGGKISGVNVPASVLPTPPSTSYSLTCQPGTYGPPPPANTTVTVTIPAPAVTVNNQTPGSGAPGSPTPNNGAVLVDPSVPNNVTITWAPPPSVTILSCSITKNGVVWQSNLASSGTIVDNATTKTTYVIDCQNAQHRHAIQTILVNVLLNYKEF